MNDMTSELMWKDKKSILSNRLWVKPGQMEENKIDWTVSLGRFVELGEGFFTMFTVPVGFTLVTSTFCYSGN